MPPLMNLVGRRRAGPGWAVGAAAVLQRPMTRTGAASRHGSGPWTWISLPGGRRHTQQERPGFDSRAGSRPTARCFGPAGRARRATPHTAAGPAWPAIRPARQPLRRTGAVAGRGRLGRARPVAAAPTARCRRRRRRRSCRRQQHQPGPGPGLLRVVDASCTDVRPTTALRTIPKAVGLC